MSEDDGPITEDDVRHVLANPIASSGPVPEVKRVVFDYDRADYPTHFLDHSLLHCHNRYWHLRYLWEFKWFDARWRNPRRGVAHLFGQHWWATFVVVRDDSTKQVCRFCGKKRSPHDD